MKRRRVDIDVSDHAVLRFMEREFDIDVDAVRQHMRSLAINAAELGAVAVAVGRVKLVIQETKPTSDKRPKVVVTTALTRSSGLGRSFK